MPEPDRALYQFDRFTVDPRQRRLYVAGQADPVELPPRAFDALLHLVERSGELLTKRELLKVLWPNVVVEENSLNQVISVIRRVLGEKPTEHRFIVTAPGRGYRFVAAVRTGGGAVTEREPVPSVAVLPFDEAAVNGELGAAVAADLVRLLSARSRIRVAAHTSSFAFKGRIEDIRSIARKLNVGRVVTGAVTRDAENVAVTARLIDGGNGQILRTLERRRHLRDLGELQADLAREIARTLDPGTAFGVGATAADPEAYLRYLRALSLSMTPNPISVMRSIALLREAVALDPAFPRAKSLLAIQYTACVMFGFPLPGALDLARHEVAGALAIDDENGETHCAAAVIDCLAGAWSRAEESFRIAHSLTADPVVSGLQCAYLSLSVGQLERALQQAEHALRVAPTHPIGVHMLATLHAARGEDEQALRYANLAVELGQSRTLAPLSDIFSEAALRAGRFDEAAGYIAAVLPERLRTDQLPELVRQLSTASGGHTGTRSAAAALRRLESSLSAEELDPPMRKRLLLWYVRVGALDEGFELAFRSLDHYAREGTVGGAWGVLWLPEMAAFRTDERFQLFALRLRLFEYWSEYGPPDGCSLDGGRLRPIR